MIYQKPFGPGMTPAKRDLQNIHDDILQLQQKVARDLAAVEADPSYWNTSKLAARRKTLADAEARLAECEARIAAEGVAA